MQLHQHNSSLLGTVYCHPRGCWLYCPSVKYSSVSSWAHTQLWQLQGCCDIHAASSRVGLKADTQSSDLLMFKGPAKGLWVSWSSVSDSPEHVSLAAKLQTLCGTCVGV